MVRRARRQSGDRECWGWGYHCRQVTRVGEKRFLGRGNSKCKGLKRGRANRPGAKPARERTDKRS